MECADTDIVSNNFFMSAPNLIFLFVIYYKIQVSTVELVEVSQSVMLSCCDMFLISLIMTVFTVFSDYSKRACVLHLLSTVFSFMASLIPDLTAMPSCCVVCTYVFRLAITLGFTYVDEHSSGPTQAKGKTLIHILHQGVCLI